jgi:hypothetical protein
MKILWLKVISIMRCWHVLVPLKEMAAYESVYRKLEEMAARPGLLLGAGRPPDAHEDDRDLPGQDTSMWQFDPP